MDGIGANTRLLRQAAAGDQQAWGELVREHGGRLRSIAAGFRLYAGDAEDAMQMTWMDLLRSIDRLHSPDRIGAWLGTSMRRNCLRILQRPRWEALPEDLVPVTRDLADEVEDAIVITERARVLWQAADRLPRRQAALLRALFADEQRSYEEIASALAMPVGAIGPIRQRALRRLSQLLKEAGSPPEDLRLSA